jgi:hypothetical protein
VGINFTAKVSLDVASLQVRRHHILTIHAPLPQMPKRKGAGGTPASSGITDWIANTEAQNKADKARQDALKAQAAAEQAQVEAEEAQNAAASLLTAQSKEKGGDSSKEGECEEPVHKKGCTPKPFDPNRQPTRQITDVLVPTEKNSAIDKAPPGAKECGIFEVASRRQDIKKDGKQKGKRREEADRKFDKKWPQEFRWLAQRQVERVKDGTVITTTAMFCIACEAAKFKNIFTQLCDDPPGGGCTSLRKNRLVEHSGLPDHKSAMFRDVEADNFKVMRNNVIFLADDIYINLFLILYSLLKMNMPFNRFGAMCLAAELPKIKIQVPVMGDSAANAFTNRIVSVDMGKYYRNPTAAVEFAFHVSEVLRDNQSDDILQGRVFAHCIDEATDKAKKQSLAQCVAYVHKGRARFEFSNIMELKKQDAETIYEADRAGLILLFGGDEQEMDKRHVGFSSDGASVVSGRKTGVVARYLHVSPRMIRIHCAAHKESLCASNASEAVEEIGIGTNQQGVRVPDPEPVDREQEERDDEEERVAQLANVGSFVLPLSHSSHTIDPTPAADSLPCMNSRYVTVFSAFIFSDLQCCNV